MARSTCRGRWCLPCHPLIRIIKLSQPAAHKWGISPAPPSCTDSLQIGSDLPPDCAMIMLSLDAVIMMAHNCWCALAAAQRPPTSRSLSVYLSMYLLTSFPSINLAFISLTVSLLCLNLFLFFPPFFANSNADSTCEALWCHLMQACALSSDAFRKRFVSPAFISAYFMPAP